MTRRAFTTLRSELRLPDILGPSYGNFPIIRLYVHLPDQTESNAEQAVRNYSYLSATIGSTLNARRAGI
jgi:hypothetical protein